VAGFLHERQAGRDRPATVYWPTDLRDIWFVSKAQSYLNTVQLSGCGFNRGTALEGQRRGRGTRAFEGNQLHHFPLIDGWQDAYLRFYGRPGKEEPTRADLEALCADEKLDYVIVEQDFPGLPAASSGRLFIYDCAKLRANRRASPPAAARSPDVVGQAE
jgi:hypothetical protein